MLGELGCSPLRGCWGPEWVPAGCPYLYAGIPRLPVPVGRYPRVGNHDGLQVEAPVTQIPAERGGRATARRKQWHPSMCLPVSQAALRGDAWNPSSRAGTQGEQAQPGLSVSVQPPGTPGQERRLCSGQGGMPTPAWDGQKLLHLNGWF